MGANHWFSSLCMPLTCCCRAYDINLSRCFTDTHTILPDPTTGTRHGWVWLVYRGVWCENAESSGDIKVAKSDQCNGWKYEKTWKQVYPVMQHGRPQLTLAPSWGELSLCFRPLTHFTEFNCQIKRHGCSCLPRDSVPPDSVRGDHRIKSR